MVELTDIFLTFLLGYAAYWDVVNDRTIPDRVVYLSLLFSLTLYFVKLFLGFATMDGLWVAALSFITLYAAFRLGLMGEAEAFYVAMLSLHRPYAPFFGLSMPLIVPLFFYASLAFAFYLLLKGLREVVRRRKVDGRYLLLLPFYAFFAIRISPYIPLPPEVHLLFFLTMAVGFLSPSLKASFRAEVPVEKAEGEIPVEGPPVLLKRHVEALLRQGRQKVAVYKYPPFLPFLLMGFLFLLFRGQGFF